MIKVFIRTIDKICSNSLWSCCISIALIITLFFSYRYVTVGFCLKKGRYLSDREYILPELTDLMNSGEIEVGPSDTSAEAYMANHPGCCVVGRNRNRSIYNALFDYRPITVGLYLEMSDMERAQSPNDSYWGLDIYLSSCGKYQDIVRAPLPPPECTDKPKSENKGE